MSFFGMFGGNNPDDKRNDDDCNSQLKEHLKKCAGFGQRPPLIDNCATSTPKSECPEPKDDLCGPPACEGSSPAPVCCPPPVSKKVPPFVPSCQIPPTLTFKCPESSCEEVKPQCEEVKPKCEEVKPKCEEVKPKCEEVKPKCEVVTCNCFTSQQSNASTTENDNSCEVKPLKM